MQISRNVLGNLACAASLLFASPAAFPGAPEGHIGSIDPELAYDLRGALARQGFYNGNLDKAAAAYMERSAYRLTKPFGQERYVDAVVCLLYLDGFQFRKFVETAGFMAWCRSITTK